jgi:hypothetical protein
MSKHEDTVRRYYSAFNARDFEAYASLFTADCFIEAPGVTARGIDAMRGFDRVWTGAFPEARLENLRMTTAGNYVLAGNWIHGGPQRGPLTGPGGTLPPLGKVLSAPYFTTFELEGDRIRSQKLVYATEMLPVLLGAG